MIRNRPRGPHRFSDAELRRIDRIPWREAWQLFAAAQRWTLDTVAAELRWHVPCDQLADGRVCWRDEITRELAMIDVVPWLHPGWGIGCKTWVANVIVAVGDHPAPSPELYETLTVFDGRTGEIYYPRQLDQYLCLPSDLPDLARQIPEWIVSGGLPTDGTPQALATEQIHRWRCRHDCWPTRPLRQRTLFSGGAT